VRFNPVQEGGRVHDRLVYYVLMADVMVGVHSVRELEASSWRGHVLVILSP
jgi:hypothetical protein